MIGFFPLFAPTRSCCYDVYEWRLVLRSVAEVV